MGPVAAELDEQRVGILAAAAISLTATWITLSFRAWIRIAATKRPGWDDASLLLAALLFTAYCTLAILMLLGTVAHGLGVSDTAPLQLNSDFSAIISSHALYIATAICFKISLALLFRASLTRHWQRCAMISTVLIDALYGSFLILAMALSCGNPSEYFTNEAMGACLSPQTNYAMQLTGCIVNGVTNWMFVVISTSILIKQSMTPSIKVCAAVLLSMACCASIASLARIQFMTKLRPGTQLFSATIDLSIWTMVECGLAIAAASAATFRPLFAESVNHMESPNPVSLGDLEKSRLRRIIASSFYSVNTNGDYRAGARTDTEASTETVSRFSLWSVSSNLKTARGKLDRKRKPNDRPALRESSIPPVPTLPPQVPMIITPPPPPPVFQDAKALSPIAASPVQPLVSLPVRTVINRPVLAELPAPFMSKVAMWPAPLRGNPPPRMEWPSRRTSPRMSSRISSWTSFRTMSSSRNSEEPGWV